MSTKPAIKIENLSKQYRLGTVGTGTFSNDVNRWWYTVRGKPDPYLAIGEANDRTSKGSSDYVWALQDVNFEVQPGEILGIIGKNGAGKSTLLKLLSRVTAPTTGKITAHGRIASLLEVGTGFHPELTGRENVFLNGAIMGMTKQEIRAKFDEIVDFSGCERYIDTPVKRYSSGMYVRLAFAVAAHLEPEILIVDEVLAVGDAEFQRKAIGKMQDVSKNQGRTVLFVSHNMANVQALCQNGLILKNGSVDFYGPINKVMDAYQEAYAESYNTNIFQGKRLKLNYDVYIEDLEILINGIKTTNLISGQDLGIRVYYKSKVKNISVKLSLGIYSTLGVKLIHMSSKFGENNLKIEKLRGYIHCNIHKIPLSAGKYILNLSLEDNNGNIDQIQNAAFFRIENGNFFGNGLNPNSNETKFLLNPQWQIGNE
jgi:lipopolysaccharide transport system ATP-binding protein